MSLTDNDWCVIRLATLQKKGEAGRLLFATVTQLSSGRPLPPKMEGVDRCNIKGTDERVFYRRTILAKQEAINWYRSLGRGSNQTPIPSRLEDRIAGDGVAINVSLLTDDPVWPQLGLPVCTEIFSDTDESGHPAPFVGTVPARVHRRFGDSDTGFDALLLDKHALTFVAQRMHIDLRQYPEYLGGAVLIVPEPVVKRIDCLMLRGDDERGERIFYRFVPRSGQTLADVRLTTFDIRHQLLTDFSTQEIPEDGILDIAKGSCSGGFGYVLSHAQHGILSYSPPTVFLRQIGFRLNPQLGGNLKVSVPMGESANSGRMEYEAARLPSPLDTNDLIGEAAPDAELTQRIIRASIRRKQQARARQSGQRWFSAGEREAAMRFVQEQIRKAHTRILIADPYLGSLQLGQFLYATHGVKVEIGLLTTRLAFKSEKGGASKLSKLADFSDRLEQLSIDRRIEPKIYVIAESALHDRFLVIDQEVWFLGNSLNALGEKASLIVKLPDAESVIQHLDAMLAMPQTQDFISYRDKVARQSGRAND